MREDQLKIGKESMSFASYWYFRFKLAYELYIIEPWEVTATYIILGLMFLAFTMFNNYVLLVWTRSAFGYWVDLPGQSPDEAPVGHGDL